MIIYIVEVNILKQNRKETAAIKAGTVTEVETKLREVYLGEFTFSVKHKLYNIVDRDDVFIEAYTLLLPGMEETFRLKNLICLK